MILLLEVLFIFNTPLALAAEHLDHVLLRYVMRYFSSQSLSTLGKL